MGCWEETCALSGLPIYGGDKCVYLEFTSTTPMKSPMGDWGKHLVKVSYGIYDSYGRLEEPHPKDWKDASCFVLKKFWDFSKSQNTKFLKDYKVEYKDEVKTYHELIQSLTPEILEQSPQLKDLPERYMPPGYKIWVDDPEKWVGFKALEQTMVSLRRVLYTGEYRGAQTDIEAWVPYISLIEAHVDLRIAKQRNSQ